MDSTIRRHISHYLADRWSEAWATILVYGSLAAIAITALSLLLAGAVTLFRFATRG